MGKSRSRNLDSSSLLCSKVQLLKEALGKDGKSASLLGLSLTSILSPLDRELIEYESRIKTAFSALEKLKGEEEAKRLFLEIRKEAISTDCVNQFYILERLVSITGQYYLI